MRSRRAVLLAFVVVFSAVFPFLTGVVALTAPATASVGDSGYGTITDGSPQAVVIISRDGTFASWSSGRPGRRWTCGYYIVDALRTSPYHQELLVRWHEGPVRPVAGEDYVLACDDDLGRRVSTRYLVYEPGDRFSGVAAVERSVDEARRSVTLPDPVIAMNPAFLHLTGVRSWFWLASGWEERRATARVGSVWATVRARPFGVLWDLGDGTRLICGRGEVYDIFRSPRGQHSSCTHVYTRTSDPDLFGLRFVNATLYWTVDWWSSTGERGELGALTRTTLAPAKVIEAQALVR